MIYLLVYIVSAGILGLEISIIRIFALYEWQNFASLIISLALVGFGLAGTLIYLFKKYIHRFIEESFLIVLIIYIISLLTGIYLYKIIPFNPFELNWDPKQLVYLILHFIILILPFTAGAAIIGIAFMTSAKISYIYFINLIGSATGCILILPFINRFHPLTTFMVIIYIQAVLTLLYALYLSHIKKRVVYTLPVLILLILIPVFHLIFYNQSTFSQYKDISYALKLPRATIVHQKYSPHGVIHIIQADGLRHVTGLSYNYQGYLPEQKGIYINGSQSGAIIPYNNDITTIDYLQYTVAYLPYYLLKDKNDISIMIAGSGSGTGILKSLLINAKHIHAIEINKQLISLMQKDEAQYSGNIYNHERLTVHNTDIRAFITGTDNHFDLIDLALLDSFNAASAGVHSISESYLYTIESFSEMYDRLTDRGILSISRWLKNPPRDTVKLFITLTDMLKQKNIPDFTSHIVCIRSSNIMTICVSKTPFNHDMIKDFNRRLSFDAVYLKNLGKTEVNQSIVLQEPYYYNTIHQYLASPKQFIKDYPFDITIPTDDSPYYFNFFKLKTIRMLHKNTIKKIPITEWGLLLLMILLIVIILISFAGIILPLTITRLSTTGTQTGIHKRTVFTYFFIIGIAFFFIEMPMIHKFILFLQHPVYSYSIIITTILFFSGIGSYFSAILPTKYTLSIFIILGIVIVIYIILLNTFFHALLHLPIIVKSMITVALLSFPSFLLGMPFPIMLTLVKQRHPSLIPWAWGINGFASVIAALLSTITALIIGYSRVLIIAVILYGIAGTILYITKKKLLP